MKRIWKDYDQMEAKLITVHDDGEPICIFIGYKEDISKYLLNNWFHFGKRGWAMVKSDNISIDDISDIQAYQRKFPDGVILGYNPIEENAKVDFEMNW